MNIYSCFFNPHIEVYDIEGAVKNWLHYGDKVFFGVPNEEYHSCFLKMQKLLDHYPVMMVGVDSTKKDPFFVGKLKDAALQACESSMVIQQDLDERIGGDRDNWERIASYTESHGFRSVFLPVIDLYGDLHHYKSVNYKWYLHKREGARRGSVNFALKEGGFDTSKSDACELIDNDGNLIPYVQLDLPFTILKPHVIHLGHVDLKSRANHNKLFWKDFWTLCEGKESNVQTEEEKLKAEVKPHGLEVPWWK